MVTVQLTKVQNYENYDLTSHVIAFTCSTDLSTQTPTITTYLNKYTHNTKDNYTLELPDPDDPYTLFGVHHFANEGCYYGISEGEFTYESFYICNEDDFQRTNIGSLFMRVSKCTGANPNLLRYPNIYDSDDVEVTIRFKRDSPIIGTIRQLDITPYKLPIETSCDPLYGFIALDQIILGDDPITVSAYNINAPTVLKEVGVYDFSENNNNYAQVIDLHVEELWPA